MKHREIIAQFEKLISVNTYFREVEKKAGAAAAADKKTMKFPDYVAKMRQFDRNNSPSGELDNRLQALTIGWDVQPDFLSNGMSHAQLLRFSKVTKGTSDRMEDQTYLAEILEVKKLFGVESDTFNPEYIKRVEKILKKAK